MYCMKCLNSLKPNEKRGIEMEFQVGDKVRKKNGEKFMYTDAYVIEVTNVIEKVILSNELSYAPQEIELATVPLVNVKDPTQPEYYHKGGIDLFGFLEKQGRIEELKAFCQVSILKYSLRYKEKNGVEDLKKVKRCLDKLIELEEKE